MSGLWKKNNFRNIRVFGCNVWIRDAARKGIFLGFIPHTDRQILFWDCESHRVKVAIHCKFDEGMNDFPSDQLPLGFQQLTRVNSDEYLPCDTKKIGASNLDFFVYPFAHKEISTSPVLPTDKDKTYGLNLANDELSGRVYIRKIINKSSVQKAFLKST